MNLDRFKLSIRKSYRRYRFHKRVGRVCSFLTFGIFTNKKKIDRLEIHLRSILIELDKYVELHRKAQHLDRRSKIIKFNNIRVNESPYDGLRVQHQRADYGIDWDVTRRQILLRDGYGCQEKDGYCHGPLQIHHIVPLSRGGTNIDTNLITLCRYHHSLKHEHMR